LPIPVIDYSFDRLMPRNSSGLWIIQRWRFDALLIDLRALGWNGAVT
jgi:hypothetical protein